MGRFSDRVTEIAGESRFSRIELEQMFSTDEQQETLTEVKEALKSATDDNEALAKINAIGEKAVKALIKVGKKALV